MEVCLGEAFRMIIGWRTRHARIAVPQNVEVFDVQDVTRLAEFLHSHVTEFRLDFFGIHRGIDDFPLFAAGRSHEDSSQAFFPITCQGTSSAHTLIIRMRVHSHQGQSFSHSASSPLSLVNRSTLHTAQLVTQRL
jgi:hypothetical protein